MNTIKNFKFIDTGISSFDAMIAALSSENAWATQFSQAYDLSPIQSALTGTIQTGMLTGSSLNGLQPLGAINVNVPDLSVTALSTSATGVSPGEWFTISSTIKNTGPVAAGASRINYYLSSDNVLSSSDTLLGSSYINSIAAGGTTSASGNFYASAYQSLGSYYVIAEADGGKELTELSETNNTRASALTLALPDLTVTALSTDRSTLSAGGVVTVSATIKNAGLGGASYSTTKFYLSKDTTWDSSDAYLDYDGVNVLGAGQSELASFNLTLPTALANGAGTYYLIAKADANSTIAESNEANNTKISAALTLQVPDLTISALSKSVTGASPGEWFTVSSTVTNAGTVAAGASQVKYYLSTDAVLSLSDIELSASYINNLAAGASSSTSTSVGVSNSQATGSYYLLAVADGANALSETNETNNVRATPLNIGLPDLTITAFTTDRLVYSAGSTASVTTTLKNIGLGGAGSSSTKFYLSKDANWDSGDTFIDYDPSNSLASGQTATKTLNITLPATLAQGAGTYYLIAKTDANNYVNESNEANNTKASAIITIQTPDLTVSALSTSAPGIGPGESFSVSSTITNIGQVAANASWVSYYLSSDNVFSASDTELGTSFINGLAAGASTTVNSTLYTSSYLTTGSYYVLAVADSGKALSESSEINNVRATPLSVGLPDLTVSALTTDKLIYAAGSSATLSVTVKNAGLGGASSSTTKFYLSKDTTLDSADTYLDYDSVRSLSAGQSDIDSLNVTLPAALPQGAGTYYVIAKADANGYITESNESNNTKVTAAITLQAPDLSVSSLSTSTANIGPGETFTVSSTIKNLGSVNAGASRVDYYLSSDASLSLSDTLLGSSYVNSIGAGASTTVDGRFYANINQTPGSYYLLAVADGGNALTEANETNNLRAMPITVGLPDLTVSTLTTDKTVYGAGSVASVTAVVKNIGLGGTNSGTTTKFYLSKDTVWDNADTYIDYDYTNAIASGQSDTASLNITLPSSLSNGPGTYYLIARADANGYSNESNEGNNTKASVALTIQAPDLSLSALSTSVSGVAPSEWFTASTTVQNTGTVAASWSYINYYLSSDSTLSASDALVGTDYVGALAAGASSTITTLLNTSGYQALGSYYLIAVADGDNRLSETNETNNARAVTLQIGAPDLTLSALTTDQTSYSAGSTVTITSTVKNIGMGGSGSSITKYYLSKDTKIDSSDSYLGYDVANALKAGESDTGTTTVTLPTTLPYGPGSYYILGQADANNYISESNEGNNTNYSVPGLLSQSQSLSATYKLWATNVGTRFATLSYGDVNLSANTDNYASNSAETTAKSYWGTSNSDSGFDDNYNAFFNDNLVLGSRWKVLDNELPGTLAQTGQNSSYSFADTVFDGMTIHAKFTTGGLYHAYIDGTLHWNQTTDGYGDSDALVAVNSDTLVLAFRGTDDQDSAFLGAQTWTGDGAFMHYEAFRPLLNSVMSYIQSHDEIKHIVVAGHSLGGAMTDIFTAVDARYFAADEGTDLYITSLASAGIDPNLFADVYDSQSYNGRYDTSIATVGTFLGFDTLSLTTPNDFYVCYANNLDRVYFENTLPNSALFAIPAGFIPNDVLASNANFTATVNTLPNLANDAVDYGSNLENGFGAHHNSLIYSRDMDALCQSSLVSYYSTQKLIFGIGNYGYDQLWLNDPVPSVDDNGARSLNGSSGNDFIFGLEGDDLCKGNAGNDLIDGGSGNDTLQGGIGNDVLDGGAGLDTADYSDKASAVTVTLNTSILTTVTVGGVVEDSLKNIENLLGGSVNDTLTGDNLGNLLNGAAGNDALAGRDGNDTLIGGIGKDQLSGGNGNDIFVFNAISETGTNSTTWDVITDFVRGQDKIDLSAIDANSTTAFNDAFSPTLIGATASFTAAGQLKFAAGILYGNTDSNLSTVEFAIALTGITALGASDLML